MANNKTNKRMATLAAIALALSLLLMPASEAAMAEPTKPNPPSSIEGLTTPITTTQNSNTATGGDSNTNTGTNSNTAGNTDINTNSNTEGNTNEQASTATITTSSLTINPERPWYEGWFTDALGWTTPPATGWRVTTTPAPSQTQQTPAQTTGQQDQLATQNSNSNSGANSNTNTGANSNTAGTTNSNTAGSTNTAANTNQQTSQSNSNTNVGPAAGAPRQEPPGSTAAAQTPGTQPPATPPAGPIVPMPGAPPAGSATVSSANLPNPGSPEELRAYLAAHQPPSTTGTASGSQPPRQLSPQEALHEVEKMKNQAISKQLKEVQEGLTNNRLTLEEAHKKITDLTTFWGMQADSKEYTNALQVFRDAAKGRQIDAERTALDRGKTYDQMSKAEQDLFNNKAEFETAVKQLSQNRDRLVKNSADSLVHVYDAVSWDKLTETQKRYFTDDVKNPAAFLTARQSAMSTLTPDEKEYLTKRDEYIAKDAALKELSAQRGKEKDPENRKSLDEQVKAAQDSVKAAFDTYRGLQDKAIGAAYKRQAEEITTQIKTLSSEADAMEPGTKKNELEKKIASLVSQQQQLDFKARAATGDLTIAERLNEFVKGYSEFSGLGQFSALFIDDKDMAKRRQEAEDLFCNTLMIGGTGCWTSKICESSIDATVGGTAVVAKAASGEPRGAARIQADKSPPALFYNETTYTTTSTILYRVSYFLTNINEETMHYNLVFYNADGTTLRAFVKDKELAPGQSDSRIRSSAIVKHSNKEYVKACLTFNPGIVKLTGGKTKQICSNIASYRGEATTTPNAQPTPSEQAAAGTEGTTSTGAGRTSGARPPQDFDGF